MSNLYSRIESLCKQRRINITEMCRASGAPRGSLTDLKKGRTSTLTASTLSKIAAFFSVTIDSLLDEEQKKSPSSDELNKDICSCADLPPEVLDVASDLNDAGVSEWVDYGRYLLEKPEYRLSGSERRIFYAAPAPAPSAPIRYIREYLTPAAAGYASPIDGEDYEMVPVDERTPPAADFSIRISGDSMEPYIPDGSRVFVQRDVSLSDFDVGIFYYNGDVYCKQFCASLPGHVHLLSANPLREDANVYIGPEESASLVCFGKVLLPRRLPPPVYR